MQDEIYISIWTECAILPVTHKKTVITIDIDNLHISMPFSPSLSSPFTGCVAINSR